MIDPVALPDAGLRVSAAQRDLAASLLREAVVDERLSFEEMEARIPAALAAHTRVDLYRILSDLVPAADLPGALTDVRVHSEAEGMTWENPLMIRSNWTGHKVLGEWDLPPFVEVLGSGWGKVELNLVQARALARVIDVVVTGNPGLLVVVPEGWGVDIQQLNTNSSAIVSSMVPTRPTGDHPRLILRGVTGSSVEVRLPNRRDRRVMRKLAESQQAERGSGPRGITPG